MKVECANKERMVDSMPDGECFVTNSGTLYIKGAVSNSDGNIMIRCTRLGTGECVLFNYDEKVIPVKAKVVIE